MSHVLVFLENCCFHMILPLGLRPFSLPLIYHFSSSGATRSVSRQNIHTHVLFQGRVLAERILHFLNRQVFWWILLPDHFYSWDKTRKIRRKSSKFLNLYNKSHQHIVAEVQTLAAITDSDVGVFMDDYAFVGQDPRIGIRSACTRKVKTLAFVWRL